MTPRTDTDRRKPLVLCAAAAIIVIAGSAILVGGGRQSQPLPIAALGTSSPHVKGRVREVTLLGHPGKIAWTQDEHALTITVPDRRPGEHAFAFRVLGVIR